MIALSISKLELEDAVLNNVQKSNSRGLIHTNLNFDENRYPVATSPRIIQHSTRRKQLKYNPLVC